MVALEYVRVCVFLCVSSLASSEGLSTHRLPGQTVPVPDLAGLLLVLDLCGYPVVLSSVTFWGVSSLPRAVMSGGAGVTVK